MSTLRSYDDPCGIARAMDCVGERWALLVVRELLLGPKRFTDLRAGLPAASPNVLSQRLRELEACHVLHKRALSSAWSLAQSVERRLAALAAPEDAAAAQLWLPLSDPQGERIAADEAPSWPVGLRLADPALERRLLTSLLESARGASSCETKLAALVRLLRRARQSAVVFTEYRDTLLHVRHQYAPRALLLHGGLTRDERSAVIAEFSNQPNRLLLATDAAAEGLNLHQQCRLVVNLELPWNPMRLEQRIGRVDRIGQRRTVHAFHLVAERSGEVDLLARLRSRVAAARSAGGAPDPFEDTERVIAELIISSTAPGQ